MKRFVTSSRPLSRNRRNRKRLGGEGAVGAERVPVRAGKKGKREACFKRRASIST